MSKPKVFVRDATGLVREFSALDAVILATGAMVGPTWIPIFASEWFLFPGVNIPASMMLCGLLSLGMGFYYVLITGIMPRSGAGGYVALSRIIHPALGMAMSFVFVMANLLDCAFISNLTVTVGVAGPLGAYAALTNNAGLTSLSNTLATPTAGFVLGTVMIIAVGLIMIAGAGLLKRINLIAFILGTLGFVIIIAIVGMVSQPQFQNIFDSFAGAGAYQKMITTAHTSGWSIPSDWVTPTVLSLPLSWFALLGFSYNTYWSGEVKRVTRSMALSVLLSIIFTAGFFAIVAAIMVQSFGLDFLTSAGYLYSAVPSQYTLSVPPWANVFVTLVNSNPIVNGLLIISYVCWGYFLLVSYYLIASRHILAWSFDRAFPTALASVSDRFHSPVRAIALTALISIVALTFFAFLPAILAPVNLTFLLIVAMILDGLAGAALPFTKKALFESAPAICKKKLAGIPLISILGIFTVIFIACLFAISLYNPAIIGPFGSATGGMAAGLLIIGAACYFLMKAYYARKGLDIALAYKEIPPE
jgi:amino acid transporter